MHWIIFFLLISCGKQKTPALKDLNDSDGDQIVNEDERSEIDKYVANVKSVKRISGSVRFYEGKTLEFEFSNQTDLRKAILQLATEPRNSLREEVYFTEWSRLRFSPDTFEALSQEFYHLNFAFNFSEDLPLELILVRQDSQVSYGAVSSSMNLEFTKGDLKDLLTGRSFLHISSSDYSSPYYRVKKEDSIKEQTYRIFFSGDKETKVYYVSKELPLEKFLSYLNVPSSSDPEKFDFFFSSDLKAINQWWLRKVGKSDVVLALASMPELSRAFVSTLSTSSKVVSRANGVPQTSFIINKPAGSKLFLRIRPTISQNVFKETHPLGDYYLPRSPFTSGLWSMSPRSYLQKCVNHTRTNAGEVILQPKLADFTDGVTFSSGKNDISADVRKRRLEEKFDQSGVYWEMMLETKTDMVEMSVTNLPAATFVKTGIFDIKCPVRLLDLKINPGLTNNEREFKMNVEAFIEKTR
ncbi:MAG TPA: hypothetical protein VNJ01_03825 [Bacteriovoracaceae bacterium]|nr:hypothetical protein [Bacteriovoracaceae bacterium]